MSDDRTAADELIKCKEANEELKEENTHLREAADAFGELAERLNTVLRDRRRHLEPDRRASAAAESIGAGHTALRPGEALSPEPRHFSHGEYDGRT